MSIPTSSSLHLSLYVYSYHHRLYLDSHQCLSLSLYRERRIYIMCACTCVCVRVVRACVWGVVPTAIGLHACALTPLGVLGTRATASHRKFGGVAAGGCAPWAGAPLGAGARRAHVPVGVALPPPDLPSLAGGQARNTAQRAPEPGVRYCSRKLSELLSSGPCESCLYPVLRGK